MYYYVKTKNQSGNSYVCVRTETIESAIEYATGASKTGFQLPLYITTEGRDEICIVVDGCCYQISDPNQIIETERRGE